MCTTGGKSSTVHPSVFSFVASSSADNTEDDGREISVRLACFRETGRCFDHYRRKMERIALNSSDDYKALSADPVNRFEMEKPNYRKAEALMDAISACLWLSRTPFKIITVA